MILSFSTSSSGLWSWVNYVITEPPLELKKARLSPTLMTYSLFSTIKQARRQELIKTVPWEIHRFHIFEDLGLYLVYGLDNSQSRILQEGRIFGDLELNKKNIRSCAAGRGGARRICCRRGHHRFRRRNIWANIRFCCFIFTYSIWLKYGLRCSYAPILSGCWRRSYTRRPWDGWTSVKGGFKECAARIDWK